MNRVILSISLLNVLSCIEARKNLAIQEKLSGLSNDWRRDTCKYIKDLPDELLRSAGLQRNIVCINALIDFQVPKAWNETEESYLDQFEFVF